MQGGQAMWVIWRNPDGRFGIGFPVKGDEMYEMWTAPTDPIACQQCAWLNGGGANFESEVQGLEQGRGREKIPDVPPEIPGDPEG